MFVIQKHHLRQLVQELKNFIPQSFPILKLAENHLSESPFAWPGIEFVVDKFPKFAACVVRPKPDATDYIPRLNRRVYSVVASDADSFTKLLQQPEVIDWTRAALPEELLEAMRRVGSNYGSIIGPETHEDLAFTGWLFKPASVALSPSIPNGYQLRQILRTDVEKIAKIWQFGAATSDTLKYFYYLHDHNFPMTGMYAPDGELVGFTFCSAQMIFQAGFVKKELRGHGFHHAVLYHIVKEMQAIGQDICPAFVSEKNVSSEKSLVKVGAEKIKDWKAANMMFIPRKVDVNDPLLIWYRKVYGSSIA